MIVSFLNSFISVSMQFKSIFNMKPQIFGKRYNKTSLLSFYIN